MVIRLLMAGLVAASFGMAGCVHNDPYHVSDEEMVKNLEKRNATIQDENEKIICQRYRPTGTLFMRTVCKTKREWEMQKHGAHDMMQKPRSGMQEGD